MNADGSARRGVSISLLGNFFPPVAGFLSAPLLAHALGVDGRGEAAAATAPLLLAMSMFTLGLPEALTYYIARRPESGAIAFRRAALYIGAVGVLVTIGIVLLSSFLAGGNAELAELIAIASIALIPCLLLVIARGVAAGYQLWTLVAIERAVGSVLRLGIVGGLMLFGALDVMTATISIAATTFAGIVVYATIPIAVRKRQIGRDSQTGPALLSFGMKIWLGSLTGVLLSRLDQLLMTPLASAYELGLYAVAVSISEVVLVFNSAVREVIFSIESEEPDIDRLGRASRISTLLTTAAAILVGIIGIWGLPWLFGAEFTPGVPVMEILLLAVALGNPGSIAGAGISARGRPGLRSWSLAAAFLVNLVLVLILVPPFGAIGAAWATVVGNCVAGYLNIIWLRVFFQVPISTFLGFRGNDVRQIFSLAGSVVRKFRK